MYELQTRVTSHPSERDLQRCAASAITFVVNPHGHTLHLAGTESLMRKGKGRGYSPNLIGWLKNHCACCGLLHNYFTVCRVLDCGRSPNCGDVFIRMHTTTQPANNNKLGLRHFLNSAHTLASVNAIRAATSVRLVIVSFHTSPPRTHKHVGSR